MMHSTAFGLLSIALCVSTPAMGQTPATSHAHEAHSGHDTAFVSRQARGRGAMGVDQYTSVHRFDALPDGGRIELQRDRDDSAGSSHIRAHMRAIARAFASGDFSTPSLVHMKTVPGAAEMRARRRSIRYVPEHLPRGAAVRIRSTDPVAVAAIHRFIAFQRAEHRASGKGKPRR